MSKPALADEVRRFVLACIPSVPYLEALLLLREVPSRPWSPAAAAARLYVADEEAARLLDGLQQGGMAARGDDGLYTYHPATDALRDGVDALAQAYARNLSGVTELIHSRQGRRAMQFARAFRWKKDGD